MASHPFSPAGRRDPYPAYRQLREAPLRRDPASGMWLLSRHADCAAALRDPRFSAALGQQQRSRADGLPRTMLTTDGPEHARLRAPGTALLGAGVVRSLTPAITAEVDALLDRLPARFDAVTTLGVPFAGAVLGLGIGLPMADWPELARLAAAASVNLDPLVTGAAAERGRRAGDELNAFLRAAEESAGAARGGEAGTRRRPSRAGESRAGESRVAEERVGAERVGAERVGAERVAMLALCVVGGFEPLAQLAGTALWWMLRRPAVAAALQAGPSGAVVAELLRLESPIPFTARVSTADVELPGGTVPAGERALVLLASANRDERVFADPDEPRPDRTPNPHLALAAGPHHCLGAPLVLTAGGVLLHRLAVRFPDLAPAGEPQWRETLLPRGLATLAVEH